MRKVVGYWPSVHGTVWLFCISRWQIWVYIFFLKALFVSTEQVINTKHTILSTYVYHLSSVTKYIYSNTVRECLILLMEAVVEFLVIYIVYISINTQYTWLWVCKYNQEYIPIIIIIHIISIMCTLTAENVLSLFNL